jgi:hypothetical protein
MGERLKMAAFDLLPQPGAGFDAADKLVHFLINNPVTDQGAACQPVNA